MSWWNSRQGNLFNQNKKTYGTHTWNNHDDDNDDFFFYKYVLENISQKKKQNRKKSMKKKYILKNEFSRSHVAYIQILEKTRQKKKRIK